VAELERQRPRTYGHELPLVTDNFATVRGRDLLGFFAPIVPGKMAFELPYAPAPALHILK